MRYRLFAKYPELVKILNLGTLAGLVRHHGHQDVWRSPFLVRFLKASHKYLIQDRHSSREMILSFLACRGNILQKQRMCQSQLEVISLACIEIVLFENYENFACCRNSCCHGAVPSVLRQWKLCRRTVHAAAAPLLAWRTHSNAVRN